VKLELVLDEVDLPWSVDPEWEQRLTRLVADVSAGSAILQVVLTDDPTLRQHNRQYRDEDRPTDVLSFSYLEGEVADPEALLPAGADLAEYLDPPAFEGEPPLVGQVLISVETVCARGPVHTGDLEQEMAFMVVHGLLHVLGFDHHDGVSASAMQAAEDQMMARLGHPAPRRGEGA
jgi:probable rRNA maturation factor